MAGNAAPVSSKAQGVATGENSELVESDVEMR